MRFKLGFVRVYSYLHLLTIAIAIPAAAATPLRGAVGNTSMENTALVSPPLNSSDGNNWPLRCWDREHHFPRATSVDVLDCILEFYKLMRTAEAEVPLRWDKSPYQTADWVWRDVQGGCALTVKKVEPDSKDTFSMMTVVHAAAMLADRCVTIANSKLGGQTFVGPGAHFWLYLTSHMLHSMTAMRLVAQLHRPELFQIVIHRQGPINNKEPAFARWAG